MHDIKLQFLCQFLLCKTWMALSRMNASAKAQQSPDKPHLIQDSEFYLDHLLIQQISGCLHVEKQSRQTLIELSFVLFSKLDWDGHRCSSYCLAICFLNESIMLICCLNTELLFGFEDYVRWETDTNICFTFFWCFINQTTSSLRK